MLRLINDKRYFNLNDIASYDLNYYLGLEMNVILIINPNPAL